MTSKSYGIDCFLVTAQMIRCEKCGRWFLKIELYRLGELTVCVDCFRLAINQSSTQSFTQYAEGRQIGGAYK